MCSRESDGEQMVVLVFGGRQRRSLMYTKDATFE